MGIPVDSPLELQRRYERADAPVYFPSDECVGETALHLRLRTALFVLLEERLRGRAFVGSGQFVYWDPTDPRACLAPDAFVRLGGPLALLPSFKIWEHGAPQVGVELLSRSDARDADLNDKLERYRRAGIREVVFFDPAAEGEPLRLWDAADGVLVERDLSAPESRRCKALDAYWSVRDDASLGRMLRLSDGSDGAGVWPTPEEAARARIAELEAELASRR